jgi:hypothetical protein
MKVETETERAGDRGESAGDGECLPDPDRLAGIWSFLGQNGPIMAD